MLSNREIAIRNLISNRNLYLFLVALTALYYYLNQQFVVLNYLWFIRISILSILISFIITLFLKTKKIDWLTLIGIFIAKLYSFILLFHILLLLHSKYCYEDKVEQTQTFNCEVVGGKRSYNQLTFLYNNETFTKLHSVKGNFNRKEEYFYEKYNLLISLNERNKDIFYIEDMFLIQK